MKPLFTYTIRLSFLIAVFFVQACSKSTEVPPPVNQVSADNVFLEDFSAVAVLTGIYATLGNEFISSKIGSLAINTGLSADEFNLDVQSSTYIDFYQNKLSANNAVDLYLWNTHYPLIYTCNAAIEGLTAPSALKSAALTPAVRMQLIGEAKFMRAYFYFNLVNLYGDVPLVLSTNYKKTTELGRVPIVEVYRQIIADLKESKELLNVDYVTAKAIGISAERVRPNKATAMALLAKVYLYNKNYAEAESEATNLINNKTQYDTVSLVSAFNKNTKETIWAIQPVQTARNTEYAKLWVLTAAPSSSQPMSLNSGLVNAFEPGDKRKTTWTGNVTVGGKTYYYSNKYRAINVAVVNNVNQPATEYSIVFRISEQYLIRAEARAQLGKFNDSRDDLNVIRKKAGLANTTVPDDQLLVAIAKERIVELFTEGHRWFDLKRTGKVNEVMSVVTPQKGGSWKISWQLYPIPNTDRLLNDNLTQNTDYEN
jgi:hypothetical protein